MFVSGTCAKPGLALVLLCVPEVASRVVFDWTLQHHHGDHLRASVQVQGPTLPGATHDGLPGDPQDHPCPPPAYRMGRVDGPAADHTYLALQWVWGYLCPSFYGLRELRDRETARFATGDQAGSVGPSAL